MTDTAPAQGDLDASETVEDAATEDAATEDAAGRFQSPRGKFEIFRAPDLRQPPTPQVMADVDLAGAADGFDYSGLLDNGEDEPEVRDAIGDMVRAIAPGSVTTPLFGQGGKDGMSLVHVWFGPNFPLFRHSHPRYGDCLYYVVAGEVVLGSQRLGPGDGFFVPNEMPYKYKAGPEGVEVLEFRAGGGIKGAPGMKLDERSVAGIRKLAELATAQHDNWAQAAPAPGGALFDPQG